MHVALFLQFVYERRVDVSRMCVEKNFAKVYVSGEEALNFIKPGNAFACNRLGIFDHYGIFVGWVDGTAWVIHFSGEGCNFINGPQIKDSLIYSFLVGK